MTQEQRPRVHPVREISVYLIAWLVFMDTFLLISTLALRAYQLGAGVFIASIITGVYSWINSIGNPIWGWVSDKYGRRLPLIIGSCITFPSLLGLAFATEWWHLLVAQLVRGIGGGAAGPITAAVAADLAPRRVLGERMSAYRMMVSIGPTFGIPIGLTLFDIGPQIPFIAAAIAEITVVLFGVFLVPETVVKMGRPEDVKPTEPKKSTRDSAKMWFGLIRRRGLAISYFGTFYTSFIPMAVPALTLPLYATLNPLDGGLGLTATHLSLIYLCSGALRMVLTIPGGALSDRVGRKWPIFLATFVDGFVWLSYPYLTPAIAFSGILALRSVDTADDSLYSGPMTAYMMEWAGPKERGKVSGINELFRTLGTGIGLPILGLMAEIFGMANSFFYASAIAFLSAAVLLLAWKKSPKPVKLEKLERPPLFRRGTIVALSGAIIVTLALIAYQLPAVLVTPEEEVPWSVEAEEYQLSHFYLHTAVPARVVPTVVESAEEKSEEIARQTDFVVHLVDVRMAIARLYWEESQPGGRTPDRYPTMEIAWGEVREVEAFAEMVVSLDWSDEAIRYYSIYQSNFTAKIFELESDGNITEFRGMFTNATERAEVLGTPDGVVDLYDLREAMATTLQEQYPTKYPSVDDAWTRLEDLETQVGYTPTP